MTDNKELRKELILNNPNLSATKLLDKAKSRKISNRKTEFLKEVRELRNLPEPSITKKERSIPIKYKVAKPKVAKPKVAKPKPSITKILKEKKIIPFDKTKFGKMVRTAQTVFNIDENNAIIYTRKILKIPKTDYNKLDQIDIDILTQYGY